MEKITNFIIDKRHYILGVFIIFTIWCGIVANKVNINHDIAKYLPDTSETRIGMNIMEEEFAGVETSTLNLMFEDLKDDEKNNIKEDLEKISGVKDVDYDESDKYNKDNYTLYVVSVDDKSDSKLASTVFEKVNEEFKDYTFYTSGDVSEANKTVLEFWVIALAVFCALIILIIMCESYTEPFLFLTAILMAVVLNKGTNIFFPSVSHITDSIAAILQMALSMDYSIMLMNRYDQEKETEKDKVKAMKKALHKSFESISSSSVTTIVGLLSLVFMSFKIGKDLGLILAKGVLFSLVCIFFVLPSLILMFDKLIGKTKKKSPIIKLDKVGSISYKARLASLPLFLIVFGTSFLLKGNLGIDYTDRASDEISKIFKENNQMAIIYPNKEEEEVSKYLDTIEGQEKIDEVLGYSNTINEKLGYDEVNAKLEDLGSDTTVEDYLLKIVYYNYFNPDNPKKVTFADFINFLENEGYNNPDVNKHIDSNMKKDINRLKNFVTVANINKKRTAADIGSILDINASNVNDLLIYYQAKNNTQKLTLQEFVEFMNKDVLPNAKYNGSIDETSKTKLAMLAKFSDNNTLNKKMTSEEIALLFGLDKTIVNNLFNYYIVVNTPTLEISIKDFTKFILNKVVTDSNYASSFTEEDIANLTMLDTFSEQIIYDREMTSEDIATLLSLDTDNVKLIISLKNAMESSSKETITPYEFVTFLLNNKDNPYLKNNLNEKLITKLNLLKTIIESDENNVTYKYDDLAKIVGMNEEITKNIYTLYFVSQNDLTLNPLEFVNFILTHQNDDALKNNLNAETLTNLILIKTIMESVINNTSYDSNSMAESLGMDKDNTSLLYGLYNSLYVNKNYTISLKNFITFLLNDVVKNPKYASSFDKDKISKLTTVNKIMTNTVNNVKYNAEEIFAITHTLSNDVEKDMLEVLYIYLGSDKSYDSSWRLTLEEFVNYLNENILNDERFTDYIDEEMRNNIIEAKDTIKDAKELLVAKNYSRVVINTKLDLEEKETFNFVKNTKNTLEKNLDEVYVIGDSPMAYEMSKTFDNELNLITVITMVAIFIVVAFTFKSLIIPIILVLTIQCAVYLTMGILSIAGENVYFIAILIVQSILMGATIDYAILYTSYYLEHRKTLDIKEAIKKSYNTSIHTILTSSSILIIVTLIIASFTSAIAAKICKTISEGTICSTILILVFLPSILALCDRFIVKKKK